MSDTTIDICGRATFLKAMFHLSSFVGRSDWLLSRTLDSPYAIANHYVQQVRTRCNIPLNHSVSTCIHISRARAPF